jgi:hypothetical protein
MACTPLDTHPSVIKNSGWSERPTTKAADVRQLRGDRSSEVTEFRIAALFFSQESTKSTWLVSRLFKDYFSHELRAEDVSNLRPIHIPLHALLVVYTSRLTERFIGFLLIFLK